MNFETNQEISQFNQENPAYSVEMRSNYDRKFVKSYDQLAQSRDTGFSTNLWTANQYYALGNQSRHMRENFTQGTDCRTQTCKQGSCSSCDISPIGPPNCYMSQSTQSYYNNLLSADKQTFLSKFCQEGQLGYGETKEEVCMQICNTNKPDWINQTSISPGNYPPWPTCTPELNCNKPGAGPPPPPPPGQTCPPASQFPNCYAKCGDNGNWGQPGSTTSCNQGIEDCKQCILAGLPGFCNLNPQARAACDTGGQCPDKFGLTCDQPRPWGNCFIDKTTGLQKTLSLYDLACSPSNNS